MAAIKDAVVIIFDVGTNAVESEAGDGPTFFEEARNCTKNIILTKLLTKPKDEVSLLLMGTDITDNEMNAEVGGYEHISTGFHMAPANWQMIKYVESIGPPNDGVTADWLDAIVVAMNYLKSLSSRVSAKMNSKIILLTTFPTTVLDDKLESVATRLNALKIELTVISTKVDEDKASQAIVEDNAQMKNESILIELIKRTNGTLCSFSEASQQLKYFDKKQIRRVPWNCDLEIGKNLIIKIAAYIYLRDGTVGGPWKAKAKRLNVVANEMQHVNPAHLGNGNSDGTLYEDPVQMGVGNINEPANGSSGEVGHSISDQEEIANANEIINGILDQMKCGNEPEVANENPDQTGVGAANASNNGSLGENGNPGETGNNTEMGNPGGIGSSSGNIGNEVYDKVVSKTEYFLNSTTVVKGPEYIKGYKYGGEFVPFEDDGPPMIGRKSLLCTGFTKKSNISDLHLAGSGVWVVVPQKKSPASVKMLTALTMAMRNTDVAMIARYANSATTAPKMMALFPSDSLNEKHSAHNSLLMHELFFKQNHIKVKFPSFCSTKTKPSTAQYEAIDNLIDSMDLSSCATFQKLHDPYLQHLCRAMETRAIHPQDPLGEIDEDINDMLYTPRHMQEQALPLIEKVKKLFKLEVVDGSAKNALMEKLRKNPSDDPSVTDGAGTSDAAMKITEIGTATPAEDLTELLGYGLSLHKLIPQIKKVINDFTFRSVELPEEKISKVLKVFRNAAQAKAPFQYNEWIEDFKLDLLDRGKVDVWQRIIVAERCGLITATESGNSAVTDREAEDFYQVKSNSTNNAAVSAGADVDMDEMFDDM